MTQWHVMSRLKGKKKVEMHIPGSSKEGAEARLADIIFAAGANPQREYWIEPVEYEVHG